MADEHDLMTFLADVGMPFLITLALVGVSIWIASLLP